MKTIFLCGWIGLIVAHCKKIWFGPIRPKGNVTFINVQRGGFGVGAREVNLQNLLRQNKQKHAFQTQK